MVLTVSVAYVDVVGVNPFRTVRGEWVAKNYRADSKSKNFDVHAILPSTCHPTLNCLHPPMRPPSRRPPIGTRHHPSGLAATSIIISRWLILPLVATASPGCPCRAQKRVSQSSLQSLAVSRARRLRTPSHRLLYLPTGSRCRRLWRLRRTTHRRRRQVSCRQRLLQPRQASIHP